MIKKNGLLLLFGLTVSLSAMDTPVVPQQIILKQVFSNEDKDRLCFFDTNPQGTRLAVACGKKVHIHEVLPDASMSKKYLVVPHQGWVKSVCFDYTGNCLVTADFTSSINIYSLPVTIDDRSFARKIGSSSIRGRKISLVASHKETPLSACYDKGDRFLQTFDIENNEIKNIKKYSDVADLSEIFFDTKENYLVMSCFRSEPQTLDCTTEKLRSLPRSSLSCFDPINNYAALLDIDEGAIWICKMKALISLVDTKKIDERSSAVQQHEEIRRLEGAFPLQYDPTFGSSVVMSFDAKGKYLVVAWRNKERILVYNIESKSIVSQYYNETTDTPKGIDLISNFPENNKMIVALGSVVDYFKKDVFMLDLP